MNTEILSFLRKHENGVSSLELARRFLKFTNPTEQVAQQIVTGILGSDKRCRRGDDGLWYSAKPGTSGEINLNALPWLAVSLEFDTTRQQGVPCAVILSRVFPQPAAVCRWSTHTGEIIHSDSTVVSDSSPTASADIKNRHACEYLLSLLTRNIPVFFTRKDESLLIHTLRKYGYRSSPNGFTCFDFTTPAGLSSVPSEEIAPLVSHLFDDVGQQFGSSDNSLLPAHCAAALLERICRHGVETIEAFEKRLLSLLQPNDFSGKSFSPDTIATLPAGRGVFGIQDTKGLFLFIGQTENLRRKVLRYFSGTANGYPKLQRLRKESFSLTTSPCGSELESLLLEYRLVAKYHPPFNESPSVGFPPPLHAPLPDCVLLLPHTCPTSLLSVWYRADRKIRMFPIESRFSSSQNMKDELMRFFFSKAHESIESNSYEHALVGNWLQRNRGECTVVDVEALDSAEELARSIEAIRDHVATGPFSQKER